MEKKTPVDILDECVELQEAKGHDYQNPNSTIKQADYYPQGVMTLLDIVHAKYLRLRSVIEAAQMGEDPNFESILDSCKDLINYTSFLGSYSTGGIQGQSESKDMFNKLIYDVKFDGSAPGTLSTMIHEDKNPSPWLNPDTYKSPFDIGGRGE